MIYKLKIISRIINKNDLFFLFIIFTLLILIYKNLINIFYQQDEWIGIGHIFIDGINHPFIDWSFWQVILGEGRPLARLLGVFFLGFNFNNVVPISIFIIINHSINVLLVYLLSKRLFENYLISIISSIFFAFSSVSSNAILWYSTAMGTLPATTLIFISIFCFLNYIAVLKKGWLFLTFSLLYLSLFFKEIGIFLFLLLPLINILYKKYSLKNFFYTFWPFIIFFIISSLFRIYEIRTLSSINVPLLTNKDNNYFLIFFIRALLYPFTSLSLIYLPSSPTIVVAKLFTNIYYPFFPSEHYNLIVQTVVLDLLAITVSFFILVIIYLLLKKAQKLESINIKFMLLFLILSFLPYILLSKTYAYLESRYYYLAAFPAGIILGFATSKLFNYFKRYVFRLILIILTISYLFLLISSLNNDLNQQLLISQERKSFLNQLNEIKPVLSSQKNIFIINGDRDFYISGNKVPFQQGIGYTLMIWYYHTGKIAKDLLEKDYLWSLGSEGYTEIDNKGFGYYYDINKAKEIIKKNNIPKDGISVLYYNSKLKKLIRVNPEDTGII